MSRTVGAYVCPRGVFAIECRFTGSGVEIQQRLDAPAALESGTMAASHLRAVLDNARIRRADVSVVVRGFGATHHILALPPAQDAMLSAIIERELRRLEPQLDDIVTAWSPLPGDAMTAGEGPPQQQVLAAAAPRSLAMELEGALRAAGHRLSHLTVLPAAVQRLYEEFVTAPAADAHAVVAPLRDGAFLGFFLGGAIRLVVEPPMADQIELDASALAEETELGAMFVRQQFRGAQVARVTIAAPASSLEGAEQAFSERLAVGTDRMTVPGLSPGGMAALGGVLDAKSLRPVALGAGDAPGNRSRLSLRSVSIAAAGVAALVGAFAVFQAMRARQASEELADANRQIEQESFGMDAVRETAGQRRLIRDALATMRIAERDRRGLQFSLASLGSAIVEPVRLDSLNLELGSNGWVTLLAGSIHGQTNPRAIQILHELYADLPLRVRIEELTLEELTYVEPAGGPQASSAVRFRFSFVLPFEPAPEG